QHERPVAIGRLQRYSTDWYFAHGMMPLFELPPPSGRHVALVGAGPASLGCAAELRKLGHAATIFERDPLPGGLNTYGIAQYKLTPRASLEEVECVKSLGVEIRTGVSVGDTVKIPAMLRAYDAVFLGLGLGGTPRLGIPGATLDGVREALE